MYTIRVHYDNGDSITTRINASVSKIVAYYLDQPMYGNDLNARGRCVEFMDVRPTLRRNGVVEILRRVYTVSEKYMERCNLCNKFRCTTERPEFYGYSVSDFAYIPGLF